VHQVSNQYTDNNLCSLEKCRDYKEKLPSTYSVTVSHRFKSMPKVIHMYPKIPAIPTHSPLPLWVPS